MTPDMHAPTSAPPRREPWYRCGVVILFIEMLIAIAVSAYSLYMTFHGLGGFPGGKLSG